MSFKSKYQRTNYHGNNFKSFLLMELSKIKIIASEELKKVKILSNLGKDSMTKQVYLKETSTTCVGIKIPP